MKQLPAQLIEWKNIRVVEIVQISDKNDDDDGDGKFANEPDPFIN